LQHAALTKMHVIPACKSACGHVVVPAVTTAAAQPAGACAHTTLACEACNLAQYNLCVLCEPQEPPWQQLDSLQAARCVLAVTRHNTAAEVQSHKRQPGTAVRTSALSLGQYMHMDRSEQSGGFWLVLGAAPVRCVEDGGCHTSTGGPELSSSSLAHLRGAVQQRCCHNMA
jgi:hypothetical protein